MNKIDLPGRTRRVRVTGTCCILMLATAAFSNQQVRYRNRSAAVNRDNITTASVANRALMIRDPAILRLPGFSGKCSSIDIATPCWTFAALANWTFDRVTAKPGQAPAFLKQWANQFQSLDTAWKGRSPEELLPEIPLVPLAVVNRLDFARVGESGCAAGKVCRAELRFVYAGVDASYSPGKTFKPYMSLIFELVLPDLSKPDFLNLAQQWNSLVDLPEPQYPAALNAVLSQTFALFPKTAKPVARLRALKVITGQWDFFEFHFENTGLVKRPLAQQPNSNLNTGFCVNDPAITAWARKNWNAIQQSDFEYVNGLQSSQATAGPPPETSTPPPGDRNVTVLTLDSSVAPANKQKELDAVRLALSINSCIGCHGREAIKEPRAGKSMLQDPDGFFQIKYASGQTILSQFLTGGETPGEPTDSYVEVVPPTVTGCAPSSPSQPQYYNDLRRRREFLDMALKSLNVNDSDAVWKAILASSGLTARQVH